MEKNYMKSEIFRKKTKVKSNNVVIISANDVNLFCRSFSFSSNKRNLLSIKENVINNLYKECLKK